MDWICFVIFCVLAMNDDSNCWIFFIMEKYPMWMDVPKEKKKELNANGKYLFAKEQFDLWVIFIKNSFLAQHLPDITFGKRRQDYWQGFIDACEK